MFRRVRRKSSSAPFQTSSIFVVETPIFGPRTFLRGENVYLRTVSPSPDAGARPERSGYVENLAVAFLILPEVGFHREEFV